MLGFYVVLALVLISITGIEMHFGMPETDVFASALHNVRNGCRGFGNGFLPSDSIGRSRAVRCRLGPLGKLGSASRLLAFFDAASRDPGPEGKEPTIGRRFV
jgi:hypothetical protein